MNGREKLLDWGRLWSDLMQEEIRRSTKDNSSSMHDEENCALASKAKRGRRRFLFPNPVLPMMGRSLTNRKCDAFVVMRWAIML